MTTKDSHWNSWLPTLLPALAAVAGSFVGVRVAFIQGENAISLETKKFELNLIREALGSNEDPLEAMNEINFLIDLGLIEKIDKNRLRETSLDRLPSFTSTNDLRFVSIGGSVPIPSVEGRRIGDDSRNYELEAWKNFNDAAQVWDLDTANEALATLIFSSHPCISRFSQDMYSMLNKDGPRAFGQVNEVRDYYNHHAYCLLSEGEDSFSGTGGSGMIYPFELPPFQFRTF